MVKRSKRNALCDWSASRRYFGLAAVLLVAAPLAWSPARAASGGDTKSAGGLTVYLGVVPAEIVTGPGPHSAERPMHGGSPQGRHSITLW